MQHVDRRRKWSVQRIVEWRRKEEDKECHTMACEEASSVVMGNEEIHELQVLKSNDNESECETSSSVASNDVKSKRVDVKSNVDDMKVNKSNDEHQEIKVNKSNVYENEHEEDSEIRMCKV